MKIVITCKTDGTVATKIVDAVGTACEGVDDFLKAHWGKGKETHTPEFFEREETNEYEQQ
jgi:hypothetical protein